MVEEGIKLQQPHLYGENGKIVGKASKNKGVGLGSYFVVANLLIIYRFKYYGPCKI